MFSRLGLPAEEAPSGGASSARDEISKASRTSQGTKNPTHVGEGQIGADVAAKRANRSVLDRLGAPEMDGKNAREEMEGLVGDAANTRNNSGPRDSVKESVKESLAREGRVHASLQDSVHTNRAQEEAQTQTQGAGRESQKTTTTENTAQSTLSANAQTNNRAPEGTICIIIFCVHPSRKKRFSQYRLKSANACINQYTFMCLGLVM